MSHLNKYRLFLLGALLSGSTNAFSAVDAQVGSGETDGYKLVWQDLFDSGELNPLRWDIEVNGAGGGNAELQYYTDKTENVRVGKDEKGNGCLILTARRESYNGKNFTSGRINSKNRIAFKHGKIEAAIKLPKTANGLWPAFWMMGNDFDAVGWPKCGETDIMEFGHQDGIRSGFQDRYFNGACHWGAGWPNASHANSVTKSYSLQDGEFHLYTLIWNENSVTMFVDLDKTPVQMPYFKMDIPCNDPGNEWSPGNYFHKENFILFNLAVGGNFPGIHDAAGITALNAENGQQASMYVNYVKIYQKGTPDESNFFMSEGDPQPSSGIDAAETAAFRLAYISVTLYSTEPCVMEVYNLSGGLVARGEGDSLALDTLAPGIYIAKARNSAGVEVTTKIRL